MQISEIKQSDAVEVIGELKELVSQDCESFMLSTGIHPLMGEVVVVTGISNSAAVIRL